MTDINKLTSSQILHVNFTGFKVRRIWDLIVSVPDHCLSFYFLYMYLHVIQELKSEPGAWLHRDELLQMHRCTENARRIRTRNTVLKLNNSYLIERGASCVHMHVLYITVHTILLTFIFKAKIDS